MTGSLKRIDRSILINNQSKLAMNVLNIDTVFYNSSPEKIANIWRIEWDRISAIKSEAARLHFSSDVFVAVAVVVA